MASYNPPSEILPIFDNSVFTTTSTGSGITLAQANALYLRKTYPDTCTAYQTFAAGLETTTLLTTSTAQVNGVFYASGGIQGTGAIRTNADIFSTGGKVYGKSLETTSNGNLTLGTGNIVSVKDITASGTITGTFSGPTSGNILSNSIEPVAVSDIMNIATTQTNATLNIGTLSTRSGNINIGTSATSGQVSIGSNGNTQTNIYGNLIYLANDTEINGDLTMSGGSIIGYLTSATASTTYATIASLSAYLTVVVASATYLTQTSASATYATITSLGNYLTTATASTTYLTITNASSTYATIAQLANYLTIASAISTYATIAQLADYLTTASATATYLTISNASATYATIAQLANYLTIASATATYLTIANASSTYLSIANATSTYLSIANATSTYLSIVNASTTYLSIVNASATYLTQATATITYATIASLSNYLTITSASATYAPKTAPSFNTSLTLTSGNVAFGTGNITTVKNITSSGNITTSTGTITGATVSASDFAGIGTCNLALNTGNITSCANITSSGTLACNTINTTLPANNLNICNGTDFTGEVNIATQPIATCDGIFLGNFFNPTTVKGDLTVLGTLTAGGFTPGTSALNTITSVLPGDNVQLYENQTSGQLNLGNGTTRTGVINIGTNTTVPCGGIYLGNDFNETTVNGDLTVLGTLTAGSSVTSFNTLTTTLTTDTANLYNNQTTGIIDLGNIAGRTGAINIGNSATQINAGVYRFTGANVETTDNTITDYSILSNVTNANIRIAHAQDSGNLVLGNNKTSGDVNIMNTGSSSGNINMGNNLTTGRISMIGNTTTSSVDISSSLRLRRGAIDFITGVGSVIDLFNNILSDITLNIGGSGYINIGQLTTRPINIGQSDGSTQINLGYLRAEANDFGGSDTAATYNLYNNVGTGILNICLGLTTGIITLGRFMASGATIKIGSDGTAGNIFIGNTGSVTTITGDLKIGSNIQLGSVSAPNKFQLGYYYNNLTNVFTSLTGPQKLYSPRINVTDGPNYFQAGTYCINVLIRYRYTGNPTALNFQFNLGAVYGALAGTVPTGTYTNFTPASTTYSRTLIAGSNNQDLCFSHPMVVTLGGTSFINIYCDITVLTRTGGSVVVELEGTIHRIA